MSRGGYRKTRIKLEAKFRASQALAIEGSYQSQVTIERGDLWIEERINKDGDCLNPDTKEVIDKIHATREEVAEGRFTPIGKNDILTKALGTNEHYGRVRGVGGSVGHKQYFGKSTYHRRGGMSQVDLEMLTQVITEKVRAETRKEMETYFEHKIRALGNSGMTRNDDPQADIEVEMICGSGKASCYEDEQSADLFAQISEKGVECQLALMDPCVRNVAIGTVYKAPTDVSKSHCLGFGENEVRVSIDIVLEGEDDAPLPVPDDEFTTVGEAIGSFVRWPKSLVTFGHPKLCTTEKSKKVQSDKSKNIGSDKIKTKESAAGSNKCLKSFLDKNSGSRRLLSRVASMMQDEVSSPITLSKNIMGFEQTIFITKKDITQLLNMEKLNISCIQAFIGCLHGLCDTDRYGFLCPQTTSLIGTDADKASRYMSKTMISEKKLIYLAPYYNEKHWMLSVIDIVNHNDIYWFDPVGNKEPTGFKTLINTSVRVYGYGGGKRKGAKAPQWVQATCAHQPGIVKCGYYIMRYMLEVVARLDHTLPLNEHFQDIKPYSQEDIDEVRDLWANYFLNF